MQFGEYLALLRRWSRVLLVATLVPGALAWGVSRLVPPAYEATAMLRVNLPVGRTLTYEDARRNEHALNTYVRIADAPVVLEEAAHRLGTGVTLEQLEQMVSVAPVPQAQLFTISAQGRVPSEAQQVANSVAAVFVEQMRERAPTQADPISVVQPAQQPTSPVEPLVLLNVAVVSVLGLIVAHLSVLITENVDETIDSEENLARTVSIPLLGSLRRVAGHQDDLEPFQWLGTDLISSAWATPFTVLAVSSPGPNVAQSRSIASLALAIARASGRVIAVDTNLGQPILHQLFGLPYQRGLTDLLAGESGAVRPALDACLLGCGNGALYPYLGFDQKEYKGIDFSQSMLEQFAVAHPSVSLQRAEGSSYRDSSQYDFIFSSSLVQYFDPRMLRTHFANIRSMMHADSLYVCAGILWRSRRIGFMSGKLLPPYRASAFGLSRTVLRTLIARNDTIGHWYDTNDIVATAGDNNMSATFYGSMTYLYRFHVVMQPRNR